MARRHWIAAGATCFSLLLVYAWLAKPESLRSKIDRRGIHLTKLDGGQKGRYTVSELDRKRLVKLFIDSGSKVSHEIEDPIVCYELNQPWFWFGHKKQVMIDFYSHEVWFNPDI